MTIWQRFDVWCQNARPAGAGRPRACTWWLRPEHFSFRESFPLLCDQSTMFAHGGMTDFTPTLEPPQNDIGSLFGQSVLLQPVGKNTIHNRLFSSSKIRHIATNMLFLWPSIVNKISFRLVQNFNTKLEMSVSIGHQKFTSLPLFKQTQWWLKHLCQYLVATR